MAEAGYCLGLHSKEEAALSPGDRYLVLIKRLWPGGRRGADKTRRFADTVCSTECLLVFRTTWE